MDRINAFGFLCLSDIPKDQIRKGDNGKLYLNVSIGLANKPFQPKPDGVVYDYYVSCAPKKEERVEGQYYSIGNLHVEPYHTADPSAATAVPSQEDMSDLPF